MKKIQSIIQNYVTNHERHKKYIAGVLALSVLVSFGVSAGLVMPAISMTEEDVIYYDNNIRVLANSSNNMVSNMNNGQDGNDGYSKGELSEGALLIGTGSELYADSASDVITNARNKYLLGIASDFCVFLENDFIPTESDAEGRVAVGGDIIFANTWNYQIGNGDYESSTALKLTDNYTGVTDYAHAIVNGKISNVNTVSRNKDNNAYPEDEDRYKRLVVGNIADSNHYIWPEGKITETEYVASGHDHDGLKPNELAQMYDAPNLIDFASSFAYIRTQSKNLSRANQTSGATVVWNGTTLTCTAPEGCTDKVIYFTLDEWNNPLEINFNNIPEGANIVINYNGTGTVDVNGDQNFEIETNINGVSISKKGTHLNNDKKSENILYNFYNVDVLQLRACINGTFLAPNADVTSFDVSLYPIDEVRDILLNGTDAQKNKLLGEINARRGHLSGSLIAKSFIGGEEFGYRPYRGTVDILPSTSGYGVPIKKFIEGGIEPLEGATFGVFEGDKITPESTFESGKDGSAYVNIPSKVDFSGGTEYTDSNNVIETTYTIKETKAPAGFVKDDSQKYVITVKETVSTNEKDFVEMNGKKIPTKVTTEITQGDETFTIELNDIYSFIAEKGDYRRIRRELKITSGGITETFLMNIDGDGKISQVMKAEGNPTDGTTVYKKAGTETSIETYTVTQTQVVTDANSQPVMATATVYVDTSNKATINEIVWNMSDASNILIDEMKVFYVEDKDGDTKGVVRTYTGFTNSGTGNFWEEITLPDNFIKDNIIGMQFKFKKKDNNTTINPETEYKLAYSKNGGNGEELITFKITDIDNEVFVPTDFPIPFTYSATSTEESTPNEEVAEEVIIIDEPEEATTEETTIAVETEENTTEETTVANETEETTTEETTVADEPEETTTEEATIADESEETTTGDTENLEEFSLYAPVIEAYALEKTEEFPLYTDKVVPATTVVSFTETKVHNVNVTAQVTVLKNYATIIANPQLSQSYPTTTATDGMNYKYDPETMMMMPQPSDTKTFENKYGLRFKKVGRLGETDSALKGATIDINSVTWNAEGKPILADIDMGNILDGGSETTIDLKDITDGKLYCFNETVAPAGYETADPIYFKKSDNTIYYTTDTEKAKSNTTTDWESVDITDTENAIEMVDIKISGAKIKLQKWDANFANRLGGAKFRLESNNGDAVYPLDENTTFEIPLNEDFDLYELLKNADSSTYNTNYIKNGYLKPGVYTLYEIDPPAGYDAGNFSFRVNSDYSIESTALGTLAYFNTTVGNGTEVTVYPLNAKGERISVSNVTKIEIELNSPTTGALELWNGPLNGNKPDITDGKVVLDNLNNLSFDSFKVQNKDYNAGVDIKEIRIYGEEGEGSGNSGDGTGLTNGMNGNNGTVTVDGALLAKAKESPDTLFIRLDKTGGGQIHITTNSITNIDDGQIADSVSKSEYSLNDILSMAKSGNKASSIDEITSVRFMEWTNGGSLTGTALLEIEVPTPETPTDPSGESNLNLTIENGIIKIPNQESGNEIDISVEKKWSGDTGFEDLRPESISVTLKRKTSDGEVDETFKDENGKDFTATLTPDENGKWSTHKWTGLDKVDNAGNKYTYYVVEDELSDYTASYIPKEGLSGAGGKLTITNKLDTTSVSGEKKWFEADGETSVTTGTPSITVQLQWQVKDDDDNDIWEDVPSYTDADEKPITFSKVLSSANNYQFTFDKLPANKEYRVVEKTVPNGWIKVSDGNKDAEGNYIITNKRDVGSLEVEKQWANDTQNDRPDEINIAVYRAVKAVSSVNTDSDISTANVAEPFEINGDSEMNKNSEQTLIAENAVGDVEWEIENWSPAVYDGESPTIDENGVLTAGDAYGILTLKATDSEKTEEEFTVYVRETAVEPNIPSNKELVKTITLTASEGWKYTLDNLPKYDATGKEYCYYIEEITGTLDGTIDGNDGAKYYPIRYDGNGLTLTGDDNKISVTNEKEDKPEIPGYELPETGGTGTTWYYITGIALMFIPIVILAKRRKKST